MNATEQAHNDMIASVLPELARLRAEHLKRHNDLHGVAFVVLDPDDPAWPAPFGMAQHRYKGKFVMLLPLATARGFVENFPATRCGGTMDPDAEPPLGCYRIITLTCCSVMLSHGLAVLPTEPVGYA